MSTDSEHRLRIDALLGAIEADDRRELQPLIVAANAGATNTGAVDRLGELAEVCRNRGLWLHVDAAYGGFASLAERGRAAFGADAFRAAIDRTLDLALLAERHADARVAVAGHARDCRLPKAAQPM